MPRDQGRWWVRIHLTSPTEFHAIQNWQGVELLAPTLRRIDERTLQVERFIPKHRVDEPADEQEQTL